MTTTTASHPLTAMLEELNGRNVDSMGIHSIIDVDASASGEVLRSEAIVQPGGGAGPLHRHRFQTERFDVLEGEIVGRLGRSRLRVKAGESFFIPADAPHSFSVEGDEPARFICEFRPGLRLAEFFSQFFALADQGRERDPLAMALLARTYPQEFFYVPTIPAAMQQAIARPLAALARRRGYSADPAGLFAR
jgi:mannose-6-phosphate isomerase-like protein (cupin superfamily)